MNLERRHHLIACAKAAKGFMPDDEGLALCDIAREVGSQFPHATMLEIGSWCGKSAVYLAIGAEETGAVVCLLYTSDAADE